MLKFQISRNGFVLKVYEDQSGRRMYFLYCPHGAALINGLEVK